MKISKKRIAIIVALILIFNPISLFAIWIVGEDVIDKLTPDYKQFEEIPKGYIKHDGESFVASNLIEKYWYVYDEKQDFFQKSELYSRVTEDDISSIEGAINIYDMPDLFPIENDYSDSFDALQNYNSKVALLVDCQDYFILQCKDNDGNIIDFDLKKQYEDSHYYLYFYDTQTTTLYFYKRII